MLKGLCGTRRYQANVREIVQGKPVKEMVRFFALLFLLIPHCDSYKEEFGCEKIVLYCMKNVVGGRGLCSLHGAMEMSFLLQVWSGDML